MTTTTPDVRQIDCPERCRFRGRDHVHLEAPDGHGQVWGLSGDGHPMPLDLFDLEQAAAVRSPLGRLR